MVGGEESCRFKWTLSWKRTLVISTANTCTFERDQRQVKAYTFVQDEVIVAHVSFAQRLDSGMVTDRYLSDWQSFARQKGFDGKLRLLFS